jgi:hypothetical protein
MAQREISPNSTTWDGGTISSTDISTLRTNMAAGATIRVDDMNNLITYYNRLFYHYHTYTDLYQTGNTDLGGFGNNGDRATYTETKSTTYPNSRALIGQLSEGLTITIDKFNEVASQSRVMQAHNHEINDRVS